MVAEPLYLLRLDVSAPRLYGLVRDHRLPLRSDDLGYFLHSGLAALFGDMRPATFAVEPGRDGERSIRLLAYSERPLAELREHAATYADPAAFQLCDWERAADKPMPANWRVGQRLGFQVRVCPTVRAAQPARHCRVGAEVDAFLVAAWRAGEGVKVDRELIYREWLAAALVRSGGAQLETAAIDKFQLEELLRRTQGEARSARPRLRKPDVTLHGALTVTDPGRFDALIRRGVGRHRAFGFGMLLLRPERGPC